MTKIQHETTSTTNHTHPDTSTACRPGSWLSDLAESLRNRGWQVPAYSLPTNVQDLSIQRILVRHGVSRDLGSLLVEDMKRSIDYFKQHPPHTRMTVDEASGFHH